MNSRLPSIQHTQQFKRAGWEGEETPEQTLKTDKLNKQLFNHSFKQS